MFSVSSYTQSIYEWDVFKVGHSYGNHDSGRYLGTALRKHLTTNLSTGISYHHQVLNSDLADASPTNINSLSLNIDVYSSKMSAQRCFAGISLGGYRYHNENLSFTFPSQDQSTTYYSVGVAPRAGYATKFLRLSVEYNYPFAAEIDGYWSLIGAFTLHFESE